MLNETELKILDGDNEIIYSGDFNIYSNKLAIGKIAGYDFIFNFITDQARINTPITESMVDDPNKRITINAVNFNNLLGVGNVQMIPVLDLVDGRRVYYSLYVRALTDISSFLKVTITFYIK